MHALYAFVGAGMIIAGAVSGGLGLFVAGAILLAGGCFKW
jgi:hypothetical protein